MLHAEDNALFLGLTEQPLYVVHDPQPGKFYELPTVPIEGTDRPVYGFMVMSPAERGQVHRWISDITDVYRFDWGTREHAISASGRNFDVRLQSRIEKLSANNIHIWVYTTFTISER